MSLITCRDPAIYK